MPNYIQFNRYNIYIIPAHLALSSFDFSILQTKTKNKIRHFETRRRRGALSSLFKGWKISLKEETYRLT